MTNLTEQAPKHLIVKSIKIKAQGFKLLGIALSASFLFSCATPQAPVTETEKPLIETPIIVSESTETVSDILKNIERNFIASGDVSARNTELLLLADKMLTQQNCISANIIAAKIEASLIDPVNIVKAQVVKAECFLAQLENSEARIPLNNAQLVQVTSWLENATDAMKQSSEAVGVDLGKDDLEKNKLNTRLVLAKAKVLGLNGEHEQALETLLSLHANNAALQSPETIGLLWDWYSLTPSQTQQKLSENYAMLNGFADLVQLSKDPSLDDTIRQSNIRAWLAAKSDLPIAEHTPQQISDYLAVQGRQKQRVAILLPLSGRLSGQGNAILQGVITAYLERNQLLGESVNTQIEIIDTGSESTIDNAVNMQTLAKFDAIIGPLLQSHIRQVRQLGLNDKKQIYLNQIEQNNASNPLVAYFALSPEQEARQLSRLMRERNIQNPIIISDQSGMANRMSAAFIEYWRQTQTLNDSQTGQGIAKTPEVQQISYTDNKNMRIGITAALDVLQSQRRIEQINNLSEDPVYSVTRNRRDVDAFVVFARPDEVELINPIIESSISLFSDEKVLVFATSYSYDHKQSKNSQRDLRNLVFIDMPWVLPDGRESDLSKQVDQLLNQPSTNFLRLFAFGYDALNIANNIAQLNTFNHIKVDGLTGTISIQDGQTLQRTLSGLMISASE